LKAEAGWGRLSKVLRRRALCLGLVKELTLRQGTFTIQDVVNETGLPRTTVQDWIHRLVDEGFIRIIEESVGRKPARYAYVRDEAFPYLACKRIFTAVDLDAGIAEIYHECSSEGAVIFCAFEHFKAKGAIIEARYEGKFLRELTILGREREVASGASMAVERVDVVGDKVIQKIRAVGGPAHSLTETMRFARGLRELKVKPMQGYVEGIVVTDMLEHVTIGVDDTDSPDSGATWALTLALLNSLKGLVEEISHKVVHLNPNVKYKTVGNAASFIEVAVAPNKLNALISHSVNFLEKETYSDNTAVAFLKGLTIPDPLKSFANRARRMEVTVSEAERVAKKAGVSVYEVTGRRGMIGAVASLAFFRAPPEVLVNSEALLA